GEPGGEPRRLRVAALAGEARVAANVGDQERPLHGASHIGSFGAWAGGTGKVAHQGNDLPSVCMISRRGPGLPVSVPTARVVAPPTGACPSRPRSPPAVG